MMLTKELLNGILQSKQADLEKSRVNATVLLARLEGAVATLQALLDLLARPEEPSEETPPPPAQPDAG